MTTQSAAGMPAPMRFTVDSWDPAYGSSLEFEDDLSESTARVIVGAEVPEDQWRPIPAAPATSGPSALLFVDGVRRIEARVWIDGSPPSPTDPGASAAMCASYAAGVLCCCAAGAHLLTTQTRRGLFTIAPHAADVVTSTGTYRASKTSPSPAVSLPMTLSAALQRRLGDLELATAVAARGGLNGHAGPPESDLLVIDGPLRGRQHLPRAIGFIKSHRTSYLPPPLHAMVAALADGERTPVFLMGTSWDRHAWYLRLPCPPGAPWSGIVRIECSADLPRADVITLASMSQATLCRYASTEYKDPRAPQNLYPIAGLERELRRRLGDPRLLYRALRSAAVA
jgi:hypothetical protein